MEIMKSTVAAKLISHTFFLLKPILIFNLQKHKFYYTLEYILKSTLTNKLNINKKHPPIGQKMNQNLKDIICGFISGWTQVIIMQPFEIVKIRLQTQSAENPYYKGMVDAFQRIAKEQGMTAFYKGTVTPLIGIGFQASAMFFTYQFSKRVLNKYKDNPKDRLPLHFIALSGIIASGPTALVAAPVQHARIRVQIQKQGDKLYNGSVDAGTKIVKKHGFGGLYRGFFPTWGREALGQAAYFVTYQSIVRQFVTKQQKVSQAPLWASLLGGACAGVSFFLFGYPFDYMKTLMQTDNLQNKKYKNMRDVFVTRLKQAGVKTFYKGLGVTLIRAIFVNAGAFFSFQASMRAMGRTQSSQ